MNTLGPLFLLTFDIFLLENKMFPADTADSQLVSDES